MGDFAMPAGSISLLDPIRSSLVFQAGGREVMRITAEGELIIAPHVQPRDAAEALRDAWGQIMGREIRT